MFVHKIKLVFGLNTYKNNVNFKVILPHKQTTSSYARKIQEINVPLLKELYKCPSSDRFWAQHRSKSFRY
jgi:hypothetical protein